MSRRHFSWLLLVTIVVAVLVVLTPGKTGKDSSIERSVFVPAMGERVNDIEWVQLTAAGGEPFATLKREQGAWVVEEAASYQADWARVKELLSSLSRAEVAEVKTSNPEYYPRLGVEDVTSPDAGGVMVSFAAETGLPALIIGNRAQGREGQYARLADSVESVLLDLPIEVPDEQSAWLDRSIIDISDAEIVEYEIAHPNQETVKAVKKSADEENFVLQNIPADSAIKSDWSVGAPANSLAALDFQDVRPATEFAWEDAIRLRLLTADGLLVNVELLSVEDGSAEDTPANHWMRLEAGVYEAGDVHSETAARANDVNGRVNGWAYQIPGYRFETMTRKMEDMLQAPAEP